MRRLPVRAGSILLAAASLVGWQFETGRAGIGERPALAAPSAEAGPGAELPTIEGRAIEPAAEAVSLRLAARPAVGSVGADETCPTDAVVALGGADASAMTVCSVHVDLGGVFATTRAPGRFGIWCEGADATFRPATVLERDVRPVGTATVDYRTVLVLELAADHAGDPPDFATLRRDPAATGGWGSGCPTLQELGAGLPIDHEITDPYVPTPDGVPLLLRTGGVLVRPAPVGVELVRLTPEIPVDASVSPEPPTSGGE